MNQTPSLGIVLSTVTDTTIEQLVETAKKAELEGISAVYINEGRGDSLAAAMAISLATEHIDIGTNIANIYFRHPYLAGHSARAIAEVSKGRFIFGLGMSHKGILKSLGIDMGDARDYLEKYASQVKASLHGDSGEGFFKTEAAKFVPPIYVAGNTVESAAVAGRVADGLMPFLSPLSYLPTLIDAANETREAANCPCIISIPTFLHEDKAEAREAARYNLAFFAMLPNYRKQWRRAGFQTAMNQIQAKQPHSTRRELASFVPDELIDQVCIFGPVKDCANQLTAFRGAGATQPVLAVSPVNEERHAATIRAIEQLAGS
ncbi:MAG: LLM class flavin-dependent oxidoreductase [Gammaproteobacteria bacterium]